MMCGSAQFSPDGKKIFIASLDSTAKMLDATTGQLIADLKGHAGYVRYAQFSPGGKKIVTASDDNTAKNNTVKIWDAATGQLIADLKGHTAAVHSRPIQP